MELNLLVQNSKNVESVTVSDQIFGKEYNRDLVHQIVVAYQAGGRQGNAAQKSRSEVRGGGAKPWRQKGMGRARAGTTRSPIWVGGGRTFAAKKRDYTQKVNKKMYRAAIRNIFSRLALDKNLVIINELNVSTPKTREFKQQLISFELTNALIICAQVSENLYLAARNIPHINTIDVDMIDPVSLLNFDKVVLTKDALKMIEERF